MFQQGRPGVLLLCLMAIIAAGPVVARAQTRTRQSGERVYPKEIRGYKVERVAVEPKQGGSEILTFGQASVITIDPLGVTLEIPIVISPVKQKGRVDFLSFYEVTINGTKVEVADYNESFELPTERALTLPRPLKVFVAMPRALIGAVIEWASPQPTWSVTGVVYVFGQFKKAIFKFKRVVPVELDRQMRNPLLDDRE
jgi:hypothetical protein